MGNSRGARETFAHATFRPYWDVRRKMVGPAGSRAYWASSSSCEAGAVRDPYWQDQARPNRQRRSGAQRWQSAPPGGGAPDAQRWFQAEQRETPGLWRPTAGLKTWVRGLSPPHRYLKFRAETGGQTHQIPRHHGEIAGTLAAIVTRPGIIAAAGASETDGLPDRWRSMKAETNHSSWPSSGKQL